MNDTDDKTPALRERGAGTRDAPGTINLDVSGTVGPDFLGQETVDVDGHWADKPGVRARPPEEHPDAKRQDTGEELPVLLESNMDHDPIEGTQGSYTVLEEGWCPRCGYDRIKHSAHTLAGVHNFTCNACGASWERPGEWRMPTTDAERVQRHKDGSATERLGDAGGHEIYTGGAMDFSLLTVRSIDHWWIDDWLDITGALIENEVISPVDVRDSAESHSRRPSMLHNLLFASAVLPGGFEISVDKEYVGPDRMVDLFGWLDG